MSLVVQKFGGSSLSSHEKREQVIDIVQQTLNKGYDVALVVSAMGRQGEPYATDTLKQLLFNEHQDIPRRALDLIMSCGEVISAAVMSAALHKNGITARAVTGPQAGFVTDGGYGEAEVLECNPDYLKELLQQGEVPVVCGFQGADIKGEINTLGRGGSDTTAVILGAALGAENVEIYTDVAGIMTADPGILKEARVIEQITYGEVFQLAHEGAKVLHPRAVEVAMRNNVNVFIKSTLEPEAGTLITGEASFNEGDYSTRGRRAVTGIAHTNDLVQFLIELEKPDPFGELEIFQLVGDAGVNIDLISVFPMLKAFIVKEEYCERVEDILNKLNVNYRVEKDCAKVSVVGVGMQNIPGVMARVVKVLKDHGIDIIQTGDSNISISLLVKQEELKTAVKVLHDEFLKV